MSNSHEVLNATYSWVSQYRKEETIYHVGPYEVRLRRWVAKPRDSYGEDIFNDVTVCIIWRATKVLVDSVSALLKREEGEPIVITPVEQTPWQRFWGIAPPQQLLPPQLPLLEEAIHIARERADRLAGINDELEKRIQEAMQELKLREAAMREIKIFLEEPADAPTELLLLQLSSGSVPARPRRRFSDLRDRMSPEAQARARARCDELTAEAQRLGLYDSVTTENVHGEISTGHAVGKEILD